jgi:hypothetical protein
MFLISKSKANNRIDFGRLWCRYSLHVKQVNNKIPIKSIKTITYEINISKCSGFEKSYPKL